MEKHVSFSQKTELQLVPASEAGLKIKNHWAAIRSSDRRVVYTGTIRQVIKFIDRLGFKPDGIGTLRYLNTASCPIEAASHLERIVF